MNKIKDNILIYRLGSLGDTVIALPCFHKVKESFPDADITLLTNRPISKKAAPAEAVLGEYFFDRVLDYPVGTRNPRILFSLLKQIRDLKINIVVNLAAARSKKSAIRDVLFFRLAGVRQLIGFPTKREDFGICLDAVSGEYEWEAKRLARRISFLGVIELSNDRYWDMRLTKAELDSAKELLGKDFLSKPFIAICTGTKMQSNDWGANNWLSLIQKLNKALPDWGLVMIGSTEEEDQANDCLAIWGGWGINLCGQTSPRVSATVLKLASIFIGHDSGPMHLAACVGTPCVGIFSGRNLPGQWHPRGQSNKIIHHITDCAGCGLETCIVQQKKCILSITVNEVEHAVLELTAEMK